MEELFKSQEVLCAKLAQAVSNFKKTGSTRRTKSYLQNRMAEAKSIWNEFNSNDITILKKATPANKTDIRYFVDDIFNKADEMYFNYISDLGDLIEKLEKPSASLNISSNVDESSSNSNSYKPLGLPKINLPKFDGNFENWQSFNDLFMSLVHTRTDVPAVNKLHYLKTSLTGEAETLLKPFSITEANYSVAWEFLNNRYNNKRILISKYLNKFINQATIKHENSTSLKNLLDVTRETLSSLNHLGVSTSQWDIIINHIVTLKFPKQTLQLWEQTLSSSTDLPTYEELKTFLESRYRTLEMLDSAPSNLELNQPYSRHVNHGSNGKSKPKSFDRSHGATTLLVSSQSRNANSCVFCKNSGHNIYKCSKFSELSALERFNQAKVLALCINCLTTGHSVKNCTSSRCRVCSAPHHSLLHRYNNSVVSSISKGSTLPESGSSTFNAMISSNLNSPSLDSSYAILATAVVHIIDNSGNSIPIRALLDSGAQLNFISENMVQLLGLKRFKVDTSISGIGNSKTQSNFLTTATIKSRTTNFEASLQMIVLPTIAGILPDSNLNIDHWNIPKNLELADPLFFKKQKIDLLIGAELFFEILAVGQIRLGPHLPNIQKTLLGWIVSGKFNSLASAQTRLVHTLTVDVPNTDPDNTLHELVEQFWKIENFDSNRANLTEEQRICEELFKLNTYRNSVGRIFVKLPFNGNVHKLGNSYYIAEKRFYSLERKLEKDVELKKLYSDFLKEYELLDHMELVPPDKECLVKYYLPHHCVIKPDSSTTKLRVVFDGSCKTTSNLSLNDTLMIGPTVQDDLFTIILRFRFHKYALKADISKMYRQMYVDESDSYHQCILWRSNIHEKLKTYRLKTVTYGTASASYLATKSLSYLADLHSNNLPLGSKIIANDFYVDDLITGGSSLEEINNIRSDVNSILRSAGMELRKWNSNHIEFISTIPETDRDSLVLIEGNSIVKTLGIAWQPSLDEFRYIISNNQINHFKISKRTVLSDLAKLFDPMGLINPIVVKGKILMQKMWLLKLDWDESLPMELHTEWKHFKEQLPLLNQLSLPRHILLENYSKLEIHGFSDASLRAYGCCLYVRCVDNSGNVSTNLLTSKSRVAPTNTLSIPRLELCASLLLARLLQKVRQGLDSLSYEVFLWTDSEIVLDWLSSHPSRWTIFVANRVSQIQELTQDIRWRHVSSKENAADILSRGATVEELLASTWYCGPTFLTKSADYWPKQKQRAINTNVPETRISYLCCLTSIQTKNYLHDIINKYSNYNKIIKIFAYIFRFIEGCRRKRYLDDHPDSKELDYSLLKIIKIIQDVHFHVEIRQLKQTQLITSQCNIKSLNPFLEHENEVQLLKVGGRLRNANIPYQAKCPILLPKNDHFVKLLISKLHVSNLHAGPQALLSILRQRFWLINGRTVVRNVVNKCIHCFHYKPKLLNQLMGDLPKSRVEPSRAFYVSGVDFCGPVLISSGFRGKSLCKAYIAVFVCFTTHAVHLELVSSLTSEAFIASLKRFTSRRGRCHTLHCDNATNFVGACKKLDDLRRKFQDQQFKNVISQWCSNQGIKFSHIPARSPHFGGIWEAAVKSAKNLLNRSLQEHHFTFEEMNTLLTQIESILNSRPISPLSSDPSDESPLTPGHFLIGGPLNAIPEFQYPPDIKISSLQRFHRLSAIQQHFWKRWSSEYILNLQIRHKWKTSASNICIGTLVLIADDSSPPQQWRLGRVVSVYPGTDGKVRVVDVQSKGKILRRQIHSLAPLPLPDV